MSKPNSAIYDYIVRERVPTDHEPDEAPITIVCEPLRVPVGASPGGSIAMRGRGQAWQAWQRVRSQYCSFR